MSNNVIRVINGGAWNDWKAVLDPIGYGNEMKYGYLASGGSEKPPHDQAPVF